MPRSAGHFRSELLVAKRGFHDGETDRCPKGVNLRELGHHIAPSKSSLHLRLLDRYVSGPSAGRVTPRSLATLALFPRALQGPMHSQVSRGLIAF